MTTPARLMAVHPVLGSRDVQWYAGIQHDGVELHLQCQDETAWAGPGDRPVYRFLVDDVDAIEVGDADAYFNEWRQKADVRRPPRDEPWGARTVDLLDPFGNTIFVMGPALSPPSMPGLTPDA